MKRSIATSLWMTARVLGTASSVFVSASVTAFASTNTPPTIAAIADQTVYVDQPAFIPLIAGDAETATNNLQLSLVSSNPTLVTPEDVVFHSFIFDGQWYLTVVPTFGLTGTATNTVTVSDGTNSTSTSFVLTVNPPPPGAARFANSSPIAIPDSGSATPYPSTINVTEMSGTVTNMTLTVSKFAHHYPDDVHMLLVGPTGQKVVIWSHCGGGNNVTNVTITLTDAAFAPLPDDFELWSEPLRPADYAANDPPINNTNDFPAPAPGGPYTNTVALSTFYGLTPNGSWSLYVYDDFPPDHGIIAGGWSLLIATTGGRQLTVSGITAADKVYDGTNSATINTGGATLVGVVGGDNVSLVTTGASGTFVNKNVGTGKTVQIAGLTLTGANAGNFTLIQPTTTAAITARVLTVSATTNTKGYDGATNATVTLADNRISGDVLTPSYTAASFNNKNVGTSKPVHVNGIAVSGADAGNYTFNTAADTTGDITVRGLTVTAATDTKGYDGTNSSSATPTITSGSLAGGDTATWTQSFTNKNVGSNKTLIPTGSVTDGNSGNNYSVAFVNNTNGVILARSLTVSATGVDKVYDTTTAATVTLSDNRLSGDIFTDSYTNALFSDKNAAIGKSISVTGIALSGADATNYTFNTTAGATANITPATLTVKADDKTRAYGATNPVFTASYTGFVGGEVLATSGVTGSPSLTTTATPTNTVSGSPYTITAAVGSLAANNYTFSFLSGLLTVTPSGASAAVIASINPSCSGAAVNFTATVTPPGAGTPTGTMQFKIDGGDFGGLVLLSGTSATSGNISTLTTGGHAITAVYGGDGNFNGTTSLVYTQMVNAVPAAPTAGDDDPVCLGATLHLTASAVTNATYSWTGPNGFISASQNPTISNVTANAAGLYSVMATVNGCVSTAGTTLVVLISPPSISGQPSGATKCVGDAITFSVSARGVNLSYQWRKDGTNITAATGSSYTNSTIGTGDAGSYDCVVSGTCSPAATSSPAILTVSPTAVAGSIAAAATSVYSGDATTITLSGYTGSIQWQSSTDNVVFTNISGQTNATLNTGPLLVTTYFQAVVSSSPCSAATSTVASVSPSTNALQITSLTSQGVDILLTWTTALGHTNFVQAVNGNPNYNTNFVDISAPIFIPGSGFTSTNYVDVGGATNAPTRFYRVRLVQ